jgi:hypothetical protein
LPQEFTDGIYNTFLEEMRTIKPAKLLETWISYSWNWNVVYAFDYWRNIQLILGNVTYFAMTNFD